jgi:hypothetical protein
LLSVTAVGDVDSTGHPALSAGMGLAWCCAQEVFMHQHNDSSPLDRALSDKLDAWRERRDGRGTADEDARRARAANKLRSEALALGAGLFLT